MTNEITIYTKTKELLKSPATIQRFQELMGERAQSFLASVLSVVYQDDKLQECEPQSILISAMKAAVLDLPVDPNIGHSAIIPYKTKATFQIMYKGIVRLALRTKEYEVINVDCVYEGEEVKRDRLTGKITINGGRTGDKIIGAFAYFKLKDGFEKFLYMTVEELEAHGAKYSPSYKYETSLWHKDKPSMYKKTVLKLLLTRFGPLSIDVKKALAEDKEPEEVVETEVTEVTEEETNKEEEPKTRAKKGHAVPREKVEEPQNNAPTGQQEAPGQAQSTKNVIDEPPPIPDNFFQPGASEQSENINPELTNYGEMYWIDHKKYKDYTYPEILNQIIKMNRITNDTKDNKEQMKALNHLDALYAWRDYRRAKLQEQE